jgi:hypothetical protein
MMIDESNSESGKHTKEVWHKMGRQSSLNANVKELGRQVHDFDGKLLDLHQCEYKIGQMVLSRLVIKNMDDESLRQSYSFMSSFRHPAAIIVENYLCKGSLVISMVDGSFLKWLTKRTPSELFSNGTMLPLLRNMVM